MRKASFYDQAKKRGKKNESQTAKGQKTLH